MMLLRQLLRAFSQAANEMLAGDGQAVPIPIPHGDGPAHRRDRGPQSQAAIRPVQDQLRPLQRPPARERISSLMDSSSSGDAIIWLMADWVYPRAFAARVELPALRFFAGRDNGSQRSTV